MACRESYIAEYEEALTERYVCPTCQAEADVIVQYDLLQGMYFPESFVDTLCPECKKDYMDKAEVK